MRNEITINLDDAARRRLLGLVADRNAPQNVWRVRVPPMSADGVGIHAIMAEADTAKTTDRRWQTRFMAESVKGLLRDRTRPPSKAPVAQD